MQPEAEERPPIFRKWQSWYWLVFAVLVLEIIFFYLISKKPG
jgi:hypothetical protein